MSEKPKTPKTKTKSRSGTSRVDLPWNGAATHLAELVGACEEGKRNDGMMACLQSKSKVKTLEQRYAEWNNEWRSVRFELDVAWEHLAMNEYSLATRATLRAIRTIEVLRKKMQ